VHDDVQHSGEQRIVIRSIDEHKAVTKSSDRWPFDVSYWTISQSEHRQSDLMSPAEKMTLSSFIAISLDHNTMPVMMAFSGTRVGLANQRFGQTLVEPLLSWLCEDPKELSEVLS
jgi:hypothetical protein